MERKEQCAALGILISQISFLSQFLFYLHGGQICHMPAQFYLICPLMQTGPLVLGQGSFVLGSLAFGVLVLSLIVAVQTPLFALGLWGGARWWPGKLQKASFIAVLHGLKSLNILNLLSTQ